MIRSAALGLLCLLFCAAGLQAQPLSAYVNLQNQFMVWDRGIIRKADYLPPVAIQIGRSAIPFLDNSRSFKIYYGGGVRTVNIGFTNEFKATDNLVAFLNARSLKVFDRGEIKNLTGLCDQYYLADSLLLFLDGIRTEYKAYYNGEVYPIENFLAGPALEVVKVTDNIAAYVNYANQFRIFYHGEILPQEDYLIERFDAGRNTVAYVDPNRRFRIFHKGRTIDAEEFPPATFTAGDDLVAYVSNEGYFKIFYQDSIYNMGYFKPQYIVGDHVVAFEDASGYFKVFHKGVVTTLESYFPENINVQYNSLAYVNRGNILRLFTEGEVYDVTTASVDHWQLNYDVLQYRMGRNLFRIFYKGMEY